VHTDPDSFPGFSGGTPDAALIAANGATANVAVEEQDAGSLLSLYRQLIRLHHDNPTVRNGTQTLLDHDAENVVSWVRRAPAGVRTSASVVFVGRLGAAGAGSAATSLDVTEGGTKVVRDLIGTNRDVVFVGEGR
jgi:glycosidase